METKNMWLLITLIPQCELAVQQYFGWTIGLYKCRTKYDYHEYGSHKPDDGGRWDRWLY